MPGARDSCRSAESCPSCRTRSAVPVKHPRVVAVAIILTFLVTAFAEALARKAKSGVKVHVLLDWVGSARMDEANLNVFDREFAQRQLADMEADLKKAKQVTHAEWQNRPWTEKLWERTVATLSPQL